MRYWDTSAIVPLLVEEEGSQLVRKWLAQDEEIVTWSLTRLELVGAIERRARTRAIDARARRDLLKRTANLAATWYEVVDILPVVSCGQSLLARHPLRAADAAQLASAAVASEGGSLSVPFVCLDHNLADAAEREGFEVFTWPAAV